MGWIKTMGSCVLALLVAGGIAASAAQASPEFYTKAAIGTTAPHVKFALTVGVQYLANGAGMKVTCTGGTGAGEATGATTVSGLHILYTGCESVPTAQKCYSPTKAAGEIETVPLDGELGAISPTIPGLRLRPASGTIFTEIECVGSPFESARVEGSVLGSFTGASGNSVEEAKLGASLKLIYAQSHGIQKYTHFLGGPPEQLIWTRKESSTTYPAESIGLSATFTIVSIPFKGNLGVTK